MATDKAPLRIPAAKGKNVWPLLSVYPGDHRESWGKHGGSKENFRLKIGEKYFVRPGEKKTFLSAAELGAELGKRVAKGFNVSFGDTPNGTVSVNLYIPQGAKVLYFGPGKLPQAEITTTTPFLREGEWMVGLGYCGKIVPVTAIKPRTMSEADYEIEPEECLRDATDE